MTQVKETTAEEHCSLGILSGIRMQENAMAQIDAAIAADENYALAKIAKAWMMHSGRDASAADTISGLLASAAQCLPSDTSRESQFWKALTLAREENVIEGAIVLEKVLLESPTDLFAHQLIQEEVFWMGRADWMREITERSAPAWSETTEGYGSFLAFRAFANEEVGFLDDAERYGRQAVEIDAGDIWGAHAVAHVLIMKGEIQRGIDWLEMLSPNWESGNQMRHHLWWHVCLFLLEQGKHERVLELLTTEIRNPDSSLVKASPAAPIDIQNFASLLLRLELYGVDVGDHWNILAVICANRVESYGNAFGSLHDMMVLTATGQFSQADELLSNIKSRYATQAGHIASSYNNVAIPGCEALLAHRNKNFSRVLSLLGDVRHDLPLIGASHAQRDLFYHLLVHAAEQEGREDLRTVFVEDVARIGFVMCLGEQHIEVVCTNRLYC